jgi:transcriptional regulator with XRE-family HTH domain
LHDAIGFGKILKFVRKSRRITQEALADSCGLDRTYIGLLERGKRSPTLETICKLSVGLNVLPSVLLRYWEDTLALKWRTQVHRLIEEAVVHSRKEARILDSHIDLNETQVMPQMQVLMEEPAHYAKEPAQHNNNSGYEYNHSSEHVPASDKVHAKKPYYAEEKSLSQEIISEIDKVVLLSIIKANTKMNTDDRFVDFDAIQLELTLLLADEGLGFDAAQNHQIAHDIASIVRGLFKESSAKNIKRYL